LRPFLGRRFSDAIVGARHGVPAPRSKRNHAMPRRVSITPNQRRFTLRTCLRQVRREARHKLAQAGRPGKHRKKNPKRRRCDTSLARMHSQEPHHKKMSSDAEFLTILKKHNIPLNPKFAMV
jgi:hypothetical protein